MSRAYCLTINNYTYEELQTFLNDYKAKYLVLGIEEGTEGTHHLQIYVYFKSPKLFTTLKNEFPRAHIEKSKGTPEQNRNYCIKEGCWFEEGDIPTQGKASFEKISDAMNNPEEDFGNYRQNYKAYINHTLSKQRTLPINKPVFMVVEDIEHIEHCLENNFFIVDQWEKSIFEEYRGEEVVVINTGAVSLSTPEVAMLKRWVAYGITPRYHEGFMVGRVTANKLILCTDNKFNRYKDLILLDTSNHADQEVYEEEEDL